MVDTTEIERAVGHRPWPLPRIPWMLFQSWQRLLFAHWRVTESALRPLVPPQLEIDRHDGRCWLGITPFHLADFRTRPLPAIPGVSDFHELNVRTYVRFGGRPGVHFFSLDAASRAAVLGARTLFRLPYHHARMSMDPLPAPGTDVDPDSQEEIHFRSSRADDHARLEVRYRPTGPAFVPRRGTLEHFLTERYALFTVLRDGTVLRGDIHHRPWSIRPAAADFAVNTMATAAGITLPDEPPLLHFAGRQDTLLWTPVRTAPTFGRR